MPSFLKSNLWVLIISNVANVFSYLFQFMLGRYLNPTDFGIFSAVNSLIVIFAFTAIVPYVVTTFTIKTAKNLEIQQYFLSKMFYGVIGFTIIFSIILVLCVPMLQSYLNLTDSLVIYLFIVNAAIALIYTFYYGLLQGYLEYVKSALSNSIILIAKFFFGIIFVIVMGGGYSAAFVSCIFANILALTITAKLAHKKINLWKVPRGTQIGSSKLVKEIVKFSIPVMLMQVIPIFYTSVDTLMVKHFFSGNEAGIYSASALLSRIVIILPGVLISTLFPQINHEVSEGKTSIVTLATVLILTALIAGGVFIFMLLFPRFVMSIFFGNAYVGQSEEYLVWMGAAMWLFSLVNVFFNFFAAKSYFTFLYPTYAILVFLMGLIFCYPPASILLLIQEIFGSILAIFFVNILLLFYLGLRSGTQVKDLWFALKKIN